MVENIEEFKKHYCRKCHRELKDEQSKKLGFGPVCYKKYLRKSKTYLFEMEENTMKLDRNDVTIFYQLLSHYDLAATNIGVIDTRKNFTHRMKELCKQIKSNCTNIYIREEGRKYTILIGDIEKTYIQLETTEDLDGKFFRQFI